MKYNVEIIENLQGSNFVELIIVRWNLFYSSRMIMIPDSEADWLLWIPFLLLYTGCSWSSEFTLSVKLGYEQVRLLNALMKAKHIKQCMAPDIYSHISICFYY